MGKAEHVDYQSITIETIDGAINDWFDTTVDAHVSYSNGDRKKVPVVFSSGERWVTSRQRKGMRDENGVLILPIISVKRTGVNPVASMSTLGTETPRLQISKQISGKTNNLQNLNKFRSPTKTMDDPIVFEVTSIPFPDRSILNYELVIQTQYITQMNTILEKMFHELDLQKTFVAPFDNHHRHPKIGVDFESREPINYGYVVGYFDSTLNENSIEEFTDQERIIKYTTSFTVPTTLQLDPEGEKPSVTVEKTSFGLTFGDESVKFVDDPLEMEEIFGRKK
jgi:hypothetical protein